MICKWKGQNGPRTELSASLEMVKKVTYRYRKKRKKRLSESTHRLVSNGTCRESEENKESRRKYDEALQTKAKELPGSDCP